jgi:uncharacterized protein (TIRG00374 family)
MVLSILALGAIIHFFLPLIEDWKEVVDQVRNAQWIWLPIAFLIQFISYLFLTWLNAMALMPFSGHITFNRLMALLTSIAFIETAIPSAGTSGIALRAHLLKKHGRFQIEASVFSLGVETIFEIVAVATTCIFGLTYLLQSGNLTKIEMVKLLALIASISIVIGFGWNIIWDHERSRRYLAKLIRYWNRMAARLPHLQNKGVLTLQKIEERLDIFQSSLITMNNMPRWKFWTAAYGKVVFDIACLGTCFYLFGYQISIGALITGYGAIILLSGLASLPGGLGVADVSTPIVFAGLGVQGSIALAAGLVYRLIAFWLLRFIGFISWQALET